MGANRNANKMEKFNELKMHIEDIVNMHIEGLFQHAHEIAETNSGDINPGQHAELMEIQERLEKLVIEQVYQNL